MSVTDYMGLTPEQIAQMDLSDETVGFGAPPDPVRAAPVARSSMGPKARATPFVPPMPPAPIAQAAQKLSGPPANVAPLVQYFVSLGINPETAVQLTSRVATMEQPTPPISNGIKIAPHDAVATMLQSKYGMRPDQAANLAKQYTDATQPQAAPAQPKTK